MLRFAVGFVGTALAIGALAPWPTDAALGPRMEHLARAGGVDVLFVGPSGIYRGLDPRVVEAQLAEAGFDLRCYNLAAPGMVDWEADQALRSGLEAAGERVTWVVVEPCGWDPRAPEHNASSYRFAHWHTLEQTHAVVAAALRADDPLDAKLAAVTTHLRHGLRRTFGYATGPQLVRSLTGTDGVAPEKQRAARASGGYLALEDDGDPNVARRGERFTGERVGEYLIEIERLRRTRRRGAPLPPDVLDDYEIASHRRQLAFLESRGIGVVHAVPPYSGMDRRWKALERSGEIEHLLDFSDPLRFGDLYRPKYRFDRQHLTREGAQIFSRAFAEAFAQVLRDELRTQR